MREKAKEISPVLKQVLEFGPPLFFFAAYLWMRDETYVWNGTEYSGFIVSALVFIPVLLASIVVLWVLTGKLSRFQIFIAVMALFFGGLTAWFNDERFFKMKTSIVYGILAVVLMIGLLRGRSFLEYVMGEHIPMESEGWMILTRRLTAFFVFLAIGNEIVWRTMSTDAWVKIETFGFPALMFVFLWSQIVALQRFMPDDENDPDSPDKA